jgi:hypothetical protein
LVNDFGMLPGAVKRIWPLAPFGAFALLALVETANALLAPGRVAPDADWAAAAADVRAGYQKGDLIVFAPAWADPIGRQHLGDLVTVEMAGRADADRYGRVWEVSIRGARAAETKGLTAQGDASHGKVRVRLYPKAPPVAVTYDFTARLADEARLTQAPRDGRGDETPCYKDAGGFRCAATRVEPPTLEVDSAPRRGILAPADGGLVTKIEFPEAKLGATLVGYTGLSDYYSRKSADGPVDFAVFVDGVRALAITHRQYEGWRRFEVDTRNWAGGTHLVRFEVSSPLPAWRTFGFHVEARK